MTHSSIKDNLESEIMKSIKVLRKNSSVELSLDKSISRQIIDEGGDENSMLQWLLQNQIEVSHSCGGMGTCGTCRILILEGQELLNSRNPIEEEWASERQLPPQERLACQTTVCGGVKILIPTEEDENVKPS